MNFCPSCGAKRLRPQDQFCMNCGQKYPKIAEEPTALAGMDAAGTAGPASAAGGHPDAGAAHRPSVQEQAAQLTSSIDQMLGAPQPAEGFEGEPARVQPSQAFAQQAVPPVADAPPLEAPPQPEQVYAPAEVPPQTEQPASLFDAVEPEEAAQATAGGEAWEPLATGEAPVDFIPGGQQAYVAEQDLFGGSSQGEGPTGGQGEEAWGARQQAGHQQQQAQRPQAGQHQPAGQQPGQPRQAAPQNAAGQPPVERSRRSQLLEQWEATQAGGEAPTGGAEQEDKWRRLQNADNLQALYEQSEQRERKKPPEIQLPPYEERPARKPRKKKRGPSIGLIVAAVFIFVVGTLGATLGMLYYNNSSGTAINTFVTALQDTDHTALRGIASPSGATFTTEGLNALSDAFSAPADRVELERQLKRQASGDSSGDTYPAIQLKSEKLFLFVNRYYIQVNGVEILAEGEHAGDLYLNGAPVVGENTEQGMLYRNLVPGTYSYELLVNGLAAKSGTTTAFDTAAPNRLGANDVGSGTTSQTATVTVENCISDEAIIYVAGNEVGEKPVGGIVTLPSVALGSEIRIVISDGDGGGQQASVVFSDLSAPNLRFGEYRDIADEPETSEPEPEDELSENEKLAQEITTADISGVLETFYRSYLKSINDQTTDTLEKSTSANTSAMASRITREDNAANTFEFGSVTVDAESVHRSEENGVPSVKFNATFAFSYTPRDGSAGSTSSSNRQTVQLIYQDGEWKVNAMTFVSEDQYSKRELAL